MIERMKKVTVLVSQKEESKFVFRLRKLGVMHIRHVEPPSSHEINFIEDKTARIESMISTLRAFEERDKKDERTTCHEKEALESAGSVAERAGERRECLGRVGELKKNLKWFAPWGEFDPADMTRLKEKGVNIRSIIL